MDQALDAKGIIYERIIAKPEREYKCFSCLPFGALLSSAIRMIVTPCSPHLPTSAIVPNTSIKMLFTISKPHSCPSGKPIIVVDRSITFSRIPCALKYFSSREIKCMGAAAKIRNSRAVGVLLTDGCIFSVYNTGPALMKWEYQAEMRLKAMLQIELCQNRLPGQFGDAEQSAILFGAHMGQVPALLDADAQYRDHFLQDGSYGHFYFLTCDHYGDVILYLLLHPDEKETLDNILSQGLDPPRPNWPVVNDAMDGDSPVLFGYTCDMPQIKKFDYALYLQGRTGTLYCFDFQEEAMRQVCGPNVEIQGIDFSKVNALLDDGAL